MQSNLEPIELAYLAGFFDGEGCVQFADRCLRVSIDNTDRRIVETFQMVFGGCAAPHRRSGARGPRYRATFQWVAHGGNARRCLNALLPYLREKRPQAELALRLGLLAPDDRIAGLAQLKALKRVDQGIVTP